MLLEKQKGLGVFDFESFFAELQSDPREYFLQAQKRLDESEMLNRPAIGKALGFLMEFIVQEDYQKFARKEPDVMWVLENVDWNEMADKKIAESILAIEDLQARAPDVITPTVINNLKSLNFRDVWIEHLYAIDSNIADKTLVSYVATSCDALNYAKENRRRNSIVLAAIRQNREKSKSCSDREANNQVRNNIHRNLKMAWGRAMWN